MLTFPDTSFRHCDGLTRRSFLKAGALGLGGLSLADLLRWEANAGLGRSEKAVINIHLDGGPPQMDLIDPKPDAPMEVRGEFASIPTTLPGLRVTELMPRVAAMADRFVFLRSLVGADNKHNAFQCQSGFKESDLASLGGRPAMGCVLSKILGASRQSVPTFVDLMQGRPLVRDSARSGFLGPAHQPFRPDMSRWFHRELEPAMKNELAALGGGHQVQLELMDELTVDRLDDRLALLERMDQLRRAVDASGAMEAMDEFHQQAVAVLTSGRLAEALDLSREDPRIVERFVPRLGGRAARDVHYTMEGPNAGKKLLLARRLVEAGVRCVSVSISDFDTHADNFDRMRIIGPVIDHALAALVTDLEERGMLADVSIVAWGEFGRTPKVNNKAGRDHWPRVAMGLMAGGGIQTGQVIGATDRYAAEATEDPVHYQDVIATLFHNLGIDARLTTLKDPTGRPQYLVEHGQPIRQLI